MAKLLAASLATLASLPTHVCAGAFQSHSAIEARAAVALEGTGLVAKPVDRGLKLAPCPEPLSADAVASNFVSVRCDRLGWRIRVPVTGAAAALASKKVIARGDQVLVQFAGTRFSVDVSGTALDDATLGGRVRVKIGQNAKTLTGEAVESGKVRVRR